MRYTNLLTYLLGAKIEYRLCTVQLINCWKVKLQDSSTRSQTERDSCRSSRCATVRVTVGYLLSCATINVSVALAIAPLFIVPFSTIGGFFINPE